MLVVSIEKLLRNNGKRNAWPALTFFVCVAHVLVCTVATQVLQYIRQNLKTCHHRVPGSNRWVENTK